MRAWAIHIKMTDAGVKRLILVSALEAEIQGMIADNKQREQEGLSLAYEGKDFYHIAQQMEEIVHKHDDEIISM